MQLKKPYWFKQLETVILLCLHLLGFPNCLIALCIMVYVCKNICNVSLKMLETVLPVRVRPYYTDYK